MKIAPRRLAGPFEIALAPHGDERGHFMRWYDEAAFAAAGLPTRWVQGNESLSRRGVVRGLHFQRPPHAETKLVRAATGAVYDVFVDLRAGSPTYGEWDAVELSAGRHNAVLVPKGFAHGFCVLSESALVTYLVDSPYAPHAEGGLAWDDPQLAIAWPVEGEPVVSAKDRRWPRLAELEPLG
jgi:dTDP-4-dehydrorhamnose 3,5-epimerase